MCSLNSLCEKDVNMLSNLMKLFFNHFNAAYLLFFNLTICALLVCYIYIFLLFSSNIVNEVFGLFISNSVGVM